jgi:hypothetical protein
MIKEILDSLEIFGVILVILFIIILAGRGCYLSGESNNIRAQEWLMACIEHCPNGTNVDASHSMGTCTCLATETTTITTTGK